MTAAELLRDLQVRGFSVAVVGDLLRVSPASDLTDADRDALRDARDDLIRAVLDPDPRVRCVDCGNWTGSRCLAYRRTGFLISPEVGRDLASQPQHCAAYADVRGRFGEVAA